MIHESLKYIATDLDSHLKKKYNSSESKVRLANILDQDGSIPEANKNKVILSLLSLEHEAVTQNAISGLNSNSSFFRANPPLSFNVNIMFSSLFNQYEEGLKFLSDTIYFFQARSLFTAQNSPKLDKRIFQLSLEVIKLNYSETYNLWASLGAKYIPSIPFKMRMLTFQNDEITQKSVRIKDQGVEALPS
ncbi:Pvc16 family protein [Ekhidna sp.]|uniref:Pvc16 family protein n=1 Tax=Ekhidna sp. TaxID=2608089 RepID=UPI003299DAA8